ncbi:BTAD domain-containing putative transcriptional regulator [Cellulomonas aerilata]|uniref:OmpR/PhoB-type domain-containing protein n=1 Tax=Cellulomonas aerilata TaxID=515326 RepID=A0A512DCX7_9CELL|nr:BTAD domain-containing putative transcriptional regulator [Cellulomonas aerilata]GEO34328.1 hypothetical protein CAE01nite_20530 [Cellulomonas aerilata]
MEHRKATSERADDVSDVRVRLLGEICVERDGGSVPLSGAKRMAVLAFLALRAPHVVSRPALVRAIWGEGAPESADNAIQVHISNLRGALGRASILTSSDGYRLSPRVAIDLQEFETAARRGVAELDACDAVAASATLRAALSLWDGPALHGLRGAVYAESEASRLESSRLVALEHRLEADIQLGRHHDVEPELEALVAANPLREELRALLMECLYLCGRQAEALQVFETGRVVLREELGVDPSPTLKEAQRRVLNQVPGTQPVRPVQEVPSGSRSAALPLLADRTVGRERDVEAVARILAEPETRLLSLLGPGGVGKTRLAVEVARAVAGDYQDGVIFVPLAQAEKPEDVAPIICQALGVSAGEDPQQAAELALSSRRAVLICDNFEHLLGAATSLSGLLAEAPGVVILTTSRQALRLRAERRYTVRPLPTTTPDGWSPATELFVLRARSSDPDFEPTPTEVDDIAAVCERCDGLPLAVELAAAHVGGLSPGELRAQLATSSRVLSGADRDYPERQQSLRASIAWSISALSAVDADFLLRTTVFRGGFTLAAAAAVAQLDTETALSRVESLLDNSLVQRTRMPDSTTRFSVLETIREYAADLLSQQDTEALSRRHAVYYRDFMDPPEYQSGLPRLAMHWRAWMAERPNLRQAVRWAAGAGEDELQADLVVGIFAMWRANGPRGELEQWLERALEGPSTSIGRQADAAYSLAILRSLRDGSTAAAPMLERARRLAEHLGDARRLFFCTCYSAILLAGAGRVEEAVEELAQAESLGRGVDDSMFEVLLHDATGIVRDCAGDPFGAAHAYEQALDIARPEGMLCTLSLLKNLSEAYVMTAPRKALDAAEEGLALASSMGVRESLADLTGQRGFASFLLGEHATAATDLAAAINDHLAQGAVFNAVEFVPRFAAALMPSEPARAAELLGVYHACVSGEEGRASIGTLVPVEHLVDLADRLGDAYERHADRGQQLVVQRGKLEALRQYCAQHLALTDTAGSSGASDPPCAWPA